MYFSGAGRNCHVSKCIFHINNQVFLRGRHKPLGISQGQAGIAMLVNYLPYKPLGIFQGQAEIAMSVNVFSTQSGTSQISISVKERKRNLPCKQTID